MTTQTVSAQEIYNKMWNISVHNILLHIQHIIGGKKRPMFELADKRPLHWPMLELPSHHAEELNNSCQSGKPSYYGAIKI